MNHNRFITLITLIGLILLLAMLFFTSPVEIGPLGVLLFFTTVYVVAFGLTVKLFQLFLRLAFKRENFTRKNYLYATVFAFAPIMFLMARSFGAINLGTSLLIVFFIALAEFLVAKRT